MLNVEGLRFAWRDRAPLVFPDLSVNPGEVVGLVGPSGSGKSTLLMLIAGLLDPAAGSIHIAGVDLAQFGGPARDRFRARHVGMVLQSFSLLPHLTIAENIAIARYLAGNTGACEDALAELGIAVYRHHRPGHLSRGQQQRAAIARAIANRPALLLADEPSSSLDAAAAATAISLLLNHSRRLGAALLIATHDLRILPQLDRTVVLEAVA